MIKRSDFGGYMDARYIDMCVYMQGTCVYMYMQGNGL